MARFGVTVQDIVDGINAVYPFTEAEPWDSVGLIVGDASAAVAGVVFALEPRLDVIAYAKLQGANVIVSHHPAFLDAPDTLTAAGTYESRVARAAIQADISLICAHTNLDASEDARRMIGERLGLIGFHEPLTLHDAQTLPTLSRFAALWETPVERSLAELARSCSHAFGSSVRVYGDPHKRVTSIMTATGSGGSHINDAFLHKADLLITGEAKYHDAVAAQQCGLAVIELGHDVSEWPLVSLLKEAVLAQTFLRPEQLTDVASDPVWWVAKGDEHV